MIMEATVSMNVPMKSSRRLIKRRITTGLEERVSIPSATIWGTRLEVITQLNAEEVPMMKRMIAVPTAVFTKMDLSCETRSSR